MIGAAFTSTSPSTHVDGSVLDYGMMHDTFPDAKSQITFF